MSDIVHVLLLWVASQLCLQVCVCVCVWVGGTVETWLYLSSTAPVRTDISTNFRRLNYKKARQRFTGKSSRSSVNVGVTVKHTQPWTGNFNRNWNWNSVTDDCLVTWQARSATMWRKELSVPVVSELYRLNKHPASVSFFSFFTTTWDGPWVWTWFRLQRPLDACDAPQARSVTLCEDDVEISEKLQLQKIASMYPREYGSKQTRKST